MSILPRKKPTIVKPEIVAQVLRNVSKKRVRAKIMSRTFALEAYFLELTETSLLLDNTLSGLDEVRLLKNRTLTLLFPYKQTLLKGQIRLTGLATHNNIRALRFSIPPNLMTDEKRGVKRLSPVPGDSHMTFHTPGFEFYHGQILDISPTGMCCLLAEEREKANLTMGNRFQAEATIDDLKLSFEAEIRHVNPSGGNPSPPEYHVGLRMIKLKRQAQDLLNEWIFRNSTFEADEDDHALNLEMDSQSTVIKEQDKPNSILVIGPKEVDLEFWYRCLGRKYEVITCDDNVANIRDSLNVGPSLLLMYLDPKNSARASFTRKFCGTVSGRPLMFFGEESDVERQKLLMGQIPNRGFLDITERKVLIKFRKVDTVMQSLPP